MTDDKEVPQSGKKVRIQKYDEAGKLLDLG
jgi:hypothetical protein